MLLMVSGMAPYTGTPHKRLSLIASCGAVLCGIPPSCGDMPQIIQDHIYMKLHRISNILDRKISGIIASSVDIQTCNEIYRQMLTPSISRYGGISFTSTRHIVGVEMAENLIRYWNNT